MNKGQIAFIGRNSAGEVVQVCSARIRCASAATAEAIALRETVRYVVHNAIVDAVIESDAQTVVQVINGHQELRNCEYASVVEEIQALMADVSQSNLLITFVPRQANSVADWISKCDSLISNMDLLCNTHSELVQLLHIDVMSASFSEE